jgi:hypothetical protein
LIIESGLNRLQRYAFVESGLVNNGVKIIRADANNYSEVDPAAIDFVCVVGEEVPRSLVRDVTNKWHQNSLVVSGGDQAQIRMALQKVVEQAHAKTHITVDAEPQQIEAVIVIRNQFDDDVFIQARNYLLGMEIPFVIASDQAGWVTGVRGARAFSEAAFDELENLAGEITIILPGGFWTHKEYNEEVEQDASYIMWALEKWRKGATIAAFGSDPWRLTARDEFKGLSVAASDMHRWSFRNTARFTEEAVIETAPRLITAKGGPAFIHVVLKLNLSKK